MNEPDGLPTGACDCHTHVVGDTDIYPMEADRHYTPGPAPYEALVRHMETMGLDRVVLVQPSFYGTDNRCLLSSLDRLEGRGRGVAVASVDSDPAMLREWHARGIRGLRVNAESAGERDPGSLAHALKNWAQPIAPLGWHLQIYAAMETIASIADDLDRLPVPVVLDHFAMVPCGTPQDSAPALALFSLLRGGNVYVKLSASYRVQSGHLSSPLKDGVTEAAATRAWASAFLAAAPERVLWGSDWPHTNRESGKTPLEVSRYRDIPEGQLQREIASWLPDDQAKYQVLVENPAHLYGF